MAIPTQADLDALDAARLSAAISGFAEVRVGGQLMRRMSTEELTIYRNEVAAEVAAAAATAVSSRRVLGIRVFKAIGVYP